MLKLKKLQILGFKSFCDRTELKFHGEGIAAIVGPNGCGKSNVSDAISWVLGEQSARTLRGARMEDVIFAGTRDRKPTGMAEVSLTLIDPDVYEGGHSGAPEVDIQDEISGEDWDEANVRAVALEDATQAEEESRPGQLMTQSGSGIQRREHCRVHWRAIQVMSGQWHSHRTENGSRPGHMTTQSGSGMQRREHCRAH